MLRRNLFLTAQYNEQLEVKDVTWINANGAEMEESLWSDANMRCFGMLMDGRAQTTGIRQRGKNATILLIVNGHHELVEFRLPECPGGRQWSLLVETNIPDDSEQASFETGNKYGVTGRSLLLFALQSENAE